MEILGGACVVTFTTLPGLSYDVQSANETRTSDWAVVFTNVPGTGELLALADTNSAGQARRFYRVLLAP